jgi:hypothetical protein
MLSPSCIPFLFLISVYVDNQWEKETDNSLLDFLVSLLYGRLGLQTETLNEFLQLINDAKINCSEVELRTFLEQQVWH